MVSLGFFEAIYEASRFRAFNDVFCGLRVGFGGGGAGGFGF